MLPGLSINFTPFSAVRGLWQNEVVLELSKLNTCIYLCFKMKCWNFTPLSILKWETLWRILRKEKVYQKNHLTSNLCLKNFIFYLSSFFICVFHSRTFVELLATLEHHKIELSIFCWTEGQTGSCTVEQKHLDGRPVWSGWNAPMSSLKRWTKNRVRLFIFPPINILDGYAPKKGI